MFPTDTISLEKTCFSKLPRKRLGTLTKTTQNSHENESKLPRFLPKTPTKTFGFCKAFEINVIEI